MVIALGGGAATAWRGVDSVGPRRVGSRVVMPCTNFGRPTRAAMPMMSGVAPNSCSMMVRVISYNDHSLRLRWLGART